MAEGARFDWHTHQDHQLAWAARGVLTVVIDTASFILPPTRALWIPAHTRHETFSTGSAIMRAVYLRPSRCPVGWAVPIPVAITSLIAELIGHLNNQALSGQRRRNAEAVLTDLLDPVAMASIDVRLPSTRTALAVADALVATPDDPSTLATWGRRVGASERTLARLFLAETGLPFGRWRTQVRLRHSLSKLARGLSVSEVAHQVGYDTTSAFVAAFRRETGQTPGRYFGAG
jgi:AraC-like DNA-binding protein